MVGLRRRRPRAAARPRRAPGASSRSPCPALAAPWRRGQRPGAEEEQHQHADARHDQRGPVERPRPAPRREEARGHPRRDDAADLVAGRPHAHHRAAPLGGRPLRHRLDVAGPTAGLRVPVHQRRHEEDRARPRRAEGEAGRGRDDHPRADEPARAHPVPEPPARVEADRVRRQVGRLHAVQRRLPERALDRRLGDREPLPAEVVARVRDPRERVGRRASLPVSRHARGRGRLAHGREGTHAPRAGHRRSLPVHDEAPLGRSPAPPHGPAW